MKWLPWLLVALVVGVVAWKLLGDRMGTYPGKGTLLPSGAPSQNRTAPADVGKDALSGAIGDAVSAAFRIAGQVTKQG